MTAMTVPSTETLRDDTLATLWERVGEVPLNRILTRPPPGTAIEADLLRLLDREPKRLCELIDGVLVEKAMGFNESCLAAILLELLGSFVRSRNLGVLTAPDGPMRMFEGRVRIPNVAFISWDRLPGRRRPTQSIPELTADLAIEILSVSNTRSEMEAKRRDYFNAGSRLVWQIDPLSRIVDVYTSPTEFSTLRATDTLTGGDVLPGFAVALADLFGELDRHG